MVAVLMVAVLIFRSLFNPIMYIHKTKQASTILLKPAITAKV